MIVVNEYVYAENCIRNKTIGDKPYYTLTILSRYYAYKGYKKKQIVELLTDFISNCYQPYKLNKDMWDDTIDKIAKNAKKTEIFQADGVWITDEELSTIKGINNKVLERLAFTLLCIAKLNNMKNKKNNGWVNTETKEVFSLARVSCSANERYVKLNTLGGLGLLEFPKKNDNLNCRVTYASDGKPTLFVSDFRELGYEYLNYLSGNDKSYIRCRECGILTKNNKSRSKIYCSSCAAYTPQRTKTISCVDCGKEIVVKAKNNMTCRCPECQRKRNNEKKRNWYTENKERDV